ncbi:hypothetical protein ACIRSU_00610 [Streptomyces sp. NPDC101160]|uniref:hypothetical protein n=1 Tax=Streptomyces sp. NPDC101160 TaxID=3366118 RepID=UPI00382C1261
MAGADGQQDQVAGGESDRLGPRAAQPAGTADDGVEDRDRQLRELDAPGCRHDDPLANLASLRRMLDLGPERLHAGHGGMLDPEPVRRWVAKEQRRLERLQAKGRLRVRADGDVPVEA